MNLQIICKSVGILLLLLAAAMALCLGLSSVIPVSGEERSALELPGWAIAIGVTTCSGLVVFIASTLFKKEGMTGDLMLRREAIAFVGISWIICSIHAGLPYLFCEPRLSLDKALFEGVSGLSTTGATVFTGLEEVPKSILLWRSTTEWLGGMGILAMFILILSGIGASGRTLLGTESSLQSTDLSLANIRQTTRSLWLLYIAATVVCGIGLLVLGMTPFQALNHAMTTTATGGFGTESDSISSFNAAIKIWIMVFMLACAISFPLYIVMIRKRRWNPLRVHEETRWYLGMVALALIVVFFNQAIEKFDGEAIDVAFDIVSIATTTGYVAGDYDQWSYIGKEVIIVLMIIGGCSGSTSGGLKMSRIILWYRLGRAELTRAFRPQLVFPIKLNGQQVPDGTGGQLFLILSFAAFFTAAGTLIVRVLEPDISIFGCFSAVLASLFNIGPAFAEFGPTSNFADLSTPTTLLLPCLMILGRLEYIAVLVLFSRKLWKQY